MNDNKRSEAATPSCEESEESIVIVDIFELNLGSRGAKDA